MLDYIILYLACGWMSIIAFKWIMKREGEGMENFAESVAFGIVVLFLWPLAWVQYVRGKGSD